MREDADGVGRGAVSLKWTPNGFTMAAKVSRTASYAFKFDSYASRSKSYMVEWHSYRVGGWLVCVGAALNPVGMNS